MRQMTYFDERETQIEEDAPQIVKESWRKAKIDMKNRFTKLQEMEYKDKVRRQEGIAWEFYEEMQKRGHNCHVSVGGLDSITLFIWLHKIGIHVPAITVSALEDKGNQRVHKALGIELVKPYKTKVEVLQECGFPVISKRIAGKIDMLQHPTEKNRTVRHAIITGECGMQGHFAKNSRMKLPQKWLRLFGGYENENEGVKYGKPDPEFLVSNDCCYWLKEKPCDDWAKSHNSYPYLGIMASEGGQREEALVEHGCNYYGKTAIRSAPFAIFTRYDVLRLATEMDQWYHDHTDLFEQLYYQQPYSKGKDGKSILYEPLGSIVPSAYGEIRKKDNGDYYICTVLESVIMAFCYGMAAESYLYEFYRFLIVFLAGGILMNIMICTRSKRWKDPEDINWFD